MGRPSEAQTTTRVQERRVAFGRNGLDNDHLEAPVLRETLGGVGRAQARYERRPWAVAAITGTSALLLGVNLVRWAAWRFIG